jgi:hypothetical protein
MTTLVKIKWFQKCYGAQERTDGRGPWTGLCC